MIKKIIFSIKRFYWELQISSLEKLIKEIRDDIEMCIKGKILPIGLATELNQVLTEHEKMIGDLAGKSVKLVMKDLKSEVEQVEQDRSEIMRLKNKKASLDTILGKYTELKGKVDAVST